MIFLEEDEKQAKGDVPKESECTTCTDGVAEYIEKDLCDGANDEAACLLEARALTKDLMDGNIDEKQFADRTVTLIDKHYGKAITGEPDGTQGD